MYLRFRSVPLLLLLLAAGIAQPARSAPAPLSPPLEERFDGNPQSAPLWVAALLGNGPTAQVTGGALVVTLPANSSGSTFQNGLKSAFALRGDFDMQVEYELREWPATNGVRLGFMYQPGADFYNTHRVSLGPGEGPGAPRESYAVDARGQTTSRVGTTDMAGMLRMTRVDDTLTGYYASPGATDWTAIGSVTFTDQDFFPAILAWSHDGSFHDQRVQVAFDNFVVTSGLVVTGSNLADFTLSKAKVKGGKTLKGRLTLDGPAPAGGLTVNLRSENPGARTPARVTIPAGKSEHQFTIRTRKRNKTKRGNLIAALRGWVYTHPLVVTRRKQ